MYESFFNLTLKPFDLLPDPDFLFMSSSHKKVLSYLDYGIHERVGFILLTGEVGTGKTTLIRNLIRKNLANVVLSKIFNTRVDSEQLIAMINDDFGLTVQNKDKITLLRDLNTFLIDQFIRGNHPVLIIDEAQNLNHDLLEEIRMLSNLESDNAKLLQIILVGQPELRKTLASEGLVQLRQRISINCYIQPLSRSEIELYILHRLEKAGDRNAVQFTPETLDIIFTYSRGIPRLINIICDFILLAAFAEETRIIDADLVQEIIGDLDFEYQYWGSEAWDGHAAPEVHGSAAASSGQSAQVFSKLLEGINTRLDKLGQESKVSQQKMFQEMADKISELERTVQFHQERTDALLKKITGKQSGMDGERGYGVAAEITPHSSMGSMFSRMFRL